MQKPTKTHSCKGHGGWCGRTIDPMDWAAGLRRCPQCRYEAKQAKQATKAGK